MKNSSVNGAVEQSALDIGSVVLYGAQVPAGSHWSNLEGRLRGLTDKGLTLNTVIPLQGIILMFSIVNTNLEYH